MNNQKDSLGKVREDLRRMRADTLIDIEILSLRAETIDVIATLDDLDVMRAAIADLEGANNG